MPPLTDLQVVGLTIWAEARNQPIEGEIAVANVIKNRLKRGIWGHDYKAVCLAPKQFSCWLASTPGDKNHIALLEAVNGIIKGEALNQALDESFTVAAAIIGEHFRDNTKVSTHYLTTALWRSDQAPSWVKGKQPATIIGDHAFFNSID